MANVINYAEQYRSELDQVLKQSMLTGDLETPMFSGCAVRRSTSPRWE